MADNKYVAVGADLTDACKKTLADMGYAMFVMRPTALLDAPVAAHPDMLFAIFDCDFITSRAYYEQERALIDAITDAGKYNLIISNTTQRSPYPSDVAFNVLYINGCVIGNSAHVSADIIKCADERGMKKINVRQGYAACSTAKVTDRAIITADSGIAEAAREAGCDALLIAPGHIELSGYDYGFIGGASGLIGGKLCFCGDVRRHPNYGDISSFCAIHGVEVVSLSDENLRDCGGIIEIKQQNTSDRKGNRYEN